MTDIEKQEIIDAVISQLLSDGRDITGLDSVESLNGISTFPAVLTTTTDGVTTKAIVSVPISLLTQAVQDVIDDAVDATTDAQSAAAGWAAAAHKTKGDITIINGNITNLQDADKSLSSLTAYAECSTAANVSSKAVTVPFFSLPTNGGCLHVKMANANTAVSGVTLNINATGAKDLLYNGSAVSATNSWRADEVLEIYYDGTNYQATNAQGGGGSADRISFDNSESGLNAENVQGAIDEVNTNMIDSFDDITTKSIADKNVTHNGVITSGHYYTYNFGVQESTSWSYITFHVSHGESYRVKSYAGSNARLWIILDSNENVIGQSTDSTNSSLKEETVTISNSSAFYMIVNCQTSLYDNPIVIKIGANVRNVDVNKLAIEGKALKRYIDDSASSAIEPYENPLETNADITSEGIVTSNHYMSFTGRESEETTLWRYFTFSNISVGDIFIISSYAGQNSRLWILLDANGNVVDCSSDNSIVGLKTEHIEITDASVASMVVNCRVNASTFNVKKVIITKSLDGDKITIDTKTLRQYISDAVGDDSNILKGKTLVCCGDSITFGADMDNTQYDDDGIAAETSITMYQWSTNSNNWVLQNTNIPKSYGFQIAERNNMIFYNGGVSGSTMQGISDKNGFSLANGRYTKLPSNIDYLTIFFGWNDTVYGTLGTIDDNTNESFYGGYNVVLPYLIEHYPYTKIALIVPFGADYAHRNAIRLLANKWGVACFDMYGAGTPLYYGKENSVGVNDSIVNSNRAKFQGHGAHPNHHGHYQISTMLEHFLRGI